MKDNLKQLLELKNMTAHSVDLFIYGDIVSSEDYAYNDEDSYPMAIRQFLDEANGRDVNVYINSGGGSVFSGMAIASMLERYQGKVKAHIDGLCGSIATAIFMAADERYISENGLFMYHKAWMPMFIAGNSKLLMNEVKQACNVLDAIDGTLLSMYERNMAEGADFETVKKKFNSGNDTWLSADETVSFFNVQKSGESVAYAKSEFIDIEKAPVALQVKPEPQKENLSNKYLFDF